jgi:hypothetical protein
MNARMNAHMNGSLFLTTENPKDDFDDLGSLSALLYELKLIGEKTLDYYLCGDKFPQLITFMGCAPHLVFSPPEDGSSSFCHIKLLKFDQPKLFTGQQTAPPRCPACRYRISEWKKELNLDTSDEDSTDKWECPKCHQQSALTDLDWRQSGGAGKILIEIKNIFPGEAVPVDKLLASLRDLSESTWKYFYIV